MMGVWYFDDLLHFVYFQGFFFRKQPLFSLYSSSRGWILIRWTVNNLYFIVYMVFVWYRKRSTYDSIEYCKIIYIFLCFLTFLEKCCSGQAREYRLEFEKKRNWYWDDPFVWHPFKRYLYHYGIITVSLLHHYSINTLLSILGFIESARGGAGTFW